MSSFSTIIPVYNRVGLVDATIQSVLRQQSPSPQNQVIIVDDGSTDGTADAIAARFGDAVQIIRQANGGPAAARNAGIAASTGQYICFLDSDDLWFTWTLQTYAEAIAKHNQPALLMAIPFEFDDAQALPAAPAPLVALFEPDYFAAHCRGLFTGTSAFVVRKDVLQACGGFSNPCPQKWILCEDIDLALRLGTAPGFVLIESPFTFAYRRHAGSSWAMMDRTFPGARFLIAQERGGQYPGGPDRRNHRLELLTRHIRPIALQCLNLGRHRQGWQLYRETFVWHLRQHRWKFLLAFPLLSALKVAKP